MSFVYIGIDVRTENNQIALIIIQPIWNSHFLRLLFIFDADILLREFGPKINWCAHAHHSFKVILNVDIRQMKNRSWNLAISILLDAPGETENTSLKLDIWNTCPRDDKLPSEAHYTESVSVVIELAAMAHNKQWQTVNVISTASQSVNSSRRCFLHVKSSISPGRTEGEFYYQSGAIYGTVYMRDSTYLWHSWLWRCHFILHFAYFWITLYRNSDWSHICTSMHRLAFVVYLCSACRSAVLVL